MDALRRGFLRGRLRPAPPPLRPPWALAEAQFVATCAPCGRCATACPTGIVADGKAGFPHIDFARGACTFCRACALACPDGALRLVENSPPWEIQAAVDAACIARRSVVCRSCADACEAHAIRFAPRLGSAALPEILAQACNGCGACVAVCPSRALAMRHAPLREGERP